MPLPVGWPSCHHGILKDALQLGDLLFGNSLRPIPKMICPVPPFAKGRNIFGNPLIAVVVGIFTRIILHYFLCASLRRRLGLFFLWPAIGFSASLLQTQ